MGKEASRQTQSSRQRGGLSLSCLSIHLLFCLFVFKLLPCPSRPFCLILASPAPFSSCRWTDGNRISFVARQLAWSSGRVIKREAALVYKGRKWGMNTQTFSSSLESALVPLACPSCPHPISFLHIHCNFTCRGRAWQVLLSPENTNALARHINGAQILLVVEKTRRNPQRLAQSILALWANLVLC